MTNYTYDAAGNLIGETLPDGEVTTYTYDDENRLTSVVEMQDATTVFSQSYILNDDGTRASASEAELQPNGATYAYNANGQRILEGNQSVFFDSKGRAIQDGNASGTNPADQYVWGLMYVNELVLRDYEFEGGAAGQYQPEQRAPPSEPDCLPAVTGPQTQTDPPTPNSHHILPSSSHLKVRFCIRRGASCLGLESWALLGVETGREMRVLIVEDEPDLLMVLSQSLREQGYAVDTATNGRDGLFKAVAGHYDAVVLDLMLPVMDGWTVLKQLRREGHLVPVLVLTARDALRDRVTGLDSGADDYVVKPFELDELHARLRALTRRSAGKAHPIIDLGDIQVDTAKRMVSRSGHPVLLTPREYALVQLLALHRGELVSRKTIYDHLFDEEDDSLSNLVDVHVSNLRKKLGKDFIVTRRGQGYLVGDGSDASGTEPSMDQDDV